MAIKFSLTAFALIISSAVFAQNEIDALKYGQTNSLGTARSIGLGGAVGALGGDFTSLSINPASIGVYRSSELAITPAIRFSTANTNYLGTNSQDDKTRLVLNNFHMVFSNPARGKDYEKSDWKSVSFGFGYNRIADFNHNVTYSGENNQSSITEIYSAIAQTEGTDHATAPPPYGYLAWQGFLLDNDHFSIPYNNIIANGGSLLQTKSLQSKGKIDEWNLTFGGNYKEKLLIGGAISLTNYRHDRSNSFQEKDLTSNNDNDFNYFTLTETINTVGAGFNLKLGALYNTEFMRIGGAVHTPTWVFLSDIMDYNLVSHTENFKQNTGNGSNPVTNVMPPNEYKYEYNLRTPWKASVNSLFFLDKYGFVTAEYEYVGYHAMRYSFSDLDREYEKVVNDNIRNTFTGGHNFRLGIEGRYENFMARLGGAYNSSPFKNAKDFGGSVVDLSAGVGARFGGFFMDLAYMIRLSETSEYAYPYLVSGIPTGLATTKHNFNIIALTLGFKF